MKIHLKIGKIRMTDLLRLFLIGILFPSQPLFGQFIPSHDATVLPTYTLSTRAGYTSNKVSLKLLNTYFKGGFLDSSIINDAINQLGTKNQFGGYIFSDFTTIFSSGKKKCTNIIRLSNVNLWEARFPKDLLGLTLKGNASYAGKNAVFDNTRYLGFNYHSIAAGWVLKNDPENNTELQFGFMPGFIAGYGHADVQIKKGSLYTSSIGDSVYVHTALNSDYSRDRGAIKINGWGFSGNTFINMTNASRKYNLNFSMDDFGFVSMSKNTNYKLDTAIGYTGIIFKLTDTSTSFLSSGNLSDSFVKPFKDKVSHRNSGSLLPTRFEVNYLNHLSGNSTLVLSAQYFLTMQTIPLINLMFVRELGIHTRTALSLHAGGLGNPGAAFSFTFLLNTHWQIDTYASLEHNLKNALTGEWYGLRVCYY